LGRRIDGEAAWCSGAYRPSLLVELWVVLLLYGGGRMEDLRLLEGRGLRRLFGWRSIPDPTTFGRFLRRGGVRLAEQLDHLLWQVVQARWAATAVPRAVMLVLDSTVVQRCGLKQAGAEKGCNPTKKGRTPTRSRRVQGHQLFPSWGTRKIFAPAPSGIPDSAAGERERGGS
jgi:hypothetical protein